MGVFALLALATVQMSATTAPIAAILLMFVSLQLATVDLLTEGTYAALMRAVPESGADVVTFVWGLYMVGTFAGSAVAGPISDHFNPRMIFFVCLPLALQIIPMLSFLPEKQLPVGQRGFRRDKVEESPQIFLLGVCMTAGALLLAFVALFLSSETQAIVSVVTSVFLCVLAWFWLPPLLAKSNLYMFLASALYVNIGGVSDYWFTAPSTCVPNGPAFSYSFYLSAAALLGSIAGLAGVSLFQIFLSRGTFRRAFFTTLLLKLVASLFDLFIVKRENVRWGIPDHLAFLLGDAVVIPVIAMLDLMPAVVLTSASCPKGMEATIYALLAGFQNFGSNVARAVGVGLVNWLEIKTTEPCNFDNFPLAIVLAHVVLPLCTAPLVFVLIPPNLITDRLFDDAEDDDENSAAERGRRSDDSGGDETGNDDEGGGNDATERKALVPTPTQPVDMELESVYYSESEQDSMASSMRRDGGSLPVKYSASFPRSSD
jgi:MFS family permease